MGQATLDLPDPLQNHAMAGGNSADDLLAQLAGEEIDRLLAEAEVERPGLHQSAPPSSPTNLQQANSHQISRPEHEVFAKATTTSGAPSAADPHTAAEASGDSQAHFDPPHTLPTPIAQADVEELDARISKELDSLFIELNADEAPPAPTAKGVPASTATVSPTTDIAPVSVPAAAPLPADPVAHATQLERNVLGKTLLDALGPTDAQASSADKVNRFLILLRPLEWLNAPLNAFSDGLREAMGKVAIMTLINALAILLYVIFLRKH